MTTARLILTYRPAPPAQQRVMPLDYDSTLLAEQHLGSIRTAMRWDKKTCRLYDRGELLLEVGVSDLVAVAIEHLKPRPEVATDAKTSSVGS